WRKVGLVLAKFRDHFGKDTADVLVIKAPTTTLNPTIDTSVIDRARESDPASALSEWDAEWRADLSSFLDDASIDAAVEHGRPLELPPQKGTTAYKAFVDPSGGRHDAFTICIAHMDGERIVADLVRGRSGDPQPIVAEYSALCREYGIGQVTGDNYAASWVETAF